MYKTHSLSSAVDMAAEIDGRIQAAKDSIKSAMCGLIEMHGAAHPSSVGAHVILKDLCRLQSQIYALDLVLMDAKRGLSE